VSQPGRVRRGLGLPWPGSARIGPPHEPTSGPQIPVTVAPQGWRRRSGAHPASGGEARPVTTIVFEPRHLRRSVISVLIIVTLWVLAVNVFWAVGHFLFVLLLSWLLAIAMEPVILRLTARGVRRGTATAIVGMFIVLCVAGVGVVFGNLFFQQTAQLVTSLPTTITQSVNWANLHFHLNLNPATISDQLKLTPSQVGGWATQIAGGVVGIVSSLLSLLFELFTFFVFAFYIAAAGPRIRRSIGRWMPPERQEVFVTVWDIASQKTGGYVISKIVLAVLSSAFHAAFFAAIGVPYWLPLALLVGITAQFIPVVGTYIGIAIPVLFVVFTSPLTAVWIIIFATIYQQIENYLFTPRVSQRTMDVNPGIALAAVFVGAAIWGPTGALIGIPLAAAVVAVVETYGRRYELVPQLAAPEFDEDEEGDVDERPPPVLDEPEVPSDDSAPVLSEGSEGSPSEASPAKASPASEAAAPSDGVGGAERRVAR
jgi:predicted PurR-regulated permease PerM